MSSEDQKDQQQASSDEDAVSYQAEVLAEAEREKEQFKKLAQRAQADLVNYRSRVRTEQEALQSRTAARVVSRFFDIADQLERALGAEATTGVDQQWVSGVEGIYQNLVNVLKAEGFERFDTDGEQFDPRRHDALLASPTNEHPPNHVIRQIAPGYSKNGDVVRPAQVEIASAPEPPGAEDQE